MIIVRHPVAVSYSSAKWTDIPFHRLVAHWIRCHELFEDDRPHVRDLMVVRYEDFVRRPQDIVGSVYKFAGLDFEHVSQTVNRHVNRKYLRKWTYRKLVSRASAYRRRIIERYGDGVERLSYGYTLDETIWI